MAQHERQTIREAVVAALLGQTEAAERVHPTREVNWARAELPAVAVYTLEESAEPKTWRGDARRNLTLAVLLVVSLNEKVDDAIDALSLEVETILMADRTLGGAHDIQYSGAKIEVDESAERPVGAARLTFDVTYFPGGRS